MRFLSNCGATTERRRGAATQQAERGATGDRTALAHSGTATAHVSGTEGITPLRNASSWIARGAARTSTISPLISSIQIRGFLSTIDGMVHSGANGDMPKRSRICLDFACIALALSPKWSQIWLAGIWGVCEASKRKFTMPTACTIPHAQVGALPGPSGDGRLRHRVAVSWRQSCAYSSFKYT